jgi:hypothetical protein
LHAGDDQITDGISLPEIVESPTNLFTVHQNLTRKLTWKDNAKDLKCVATHVALDGTMLPTIKQIAVRCEYMRNDNALCNNFKYLSNSYAFLLIQLKY